MTGNSQRILRPHKITVYNRQRGVRIPLNALQQFAQRALTEILKIKRRRITELESTADLHVVLVSDRRMAELHRRFLHVPGPTDVITFQHGEIVISVERARSQARQFRSTTEKELCLYIAHGLLHLHQFDDTTPDAARTMERLQKRIIQAAQRSGVPEG